MSLSTKTILVELRKPSKEFLVARICYNTKMLATVLFVISFAAVGGMSTYYSQHAEAVSQQDVGNNYNNVNASS